MRDPTFELARSKALESYREIGWVEVEAFAKEHAIDIGSFLAAGLLKERPSPTGSYYHYALADIGETFMRFDAQWVAILVDPHKAEDLLGVVAVQPREEPNGITIRRARSWITDLNERHAELSRQIDKMRTEVAISEERVRQLQAEHEQLKADGPAWVSTLEDHAYWAFCRRWDSERRRIRIAYLFIGVTFGAVAASYIGPWLVATEGPILFQSSMWSFASSLLIVLPLLFSAGYFLFASVDKRRTEAAISARRAGGSLEDFREWRARRRGDWWTSPTT